MKLLQNPKFTGTAIVLLLLLNSALLVLLLMKAPAPPDGPGKMPPGEGPRNYIVQELKLDANQQKEYEILIKEHRGQVEQLQSEIKNLRDSMVSNLETDAPNDSVVNQLSKQVGEKQQQLEQVTFDHFIKLRKICNDEQKVRFGQIIRDVLRMMGPPRPGRPGQGPPPPGN